MLQSVDEAMSVIEVQTRKLGAIRTSPHLAAGHRLAAPVEMGGDSPPFDRALLDGYAVRSADAHVETRLLIIGRQDAGGASWEGQIKQGECLAINTGAIFPPGADAVLMVEHSRQAGPNHIQATQAVPAGYGVQRRGAQAKAGSIALAAGALLSPASIAAAISAGAAEVTVWRRPRVAVLATGDELLPAENAPAQPGPGRIPNSNSPMLLALVHECGCDTLDLGACGDQRELLKGTLERGLRQADVLLVTGGMSMGTKDLVPPLLKESGVAFHIEKVRMKPGKPFVFGTLDEPGGGRKSVAGLPGNPVSAFVTFHLFVRPMLELLAGGEPARRFITAQAGRPFAANGDREFFEPCVLSRRGAMLIAEPAAWGGSGDILTISRLGEHGALARRPANAPELRAGETLEVLPLSAGF